jgi:hypothetical protein
MPCSTCASNEYVLQACTPVSDTVCAFGFPENGNTVTIQLHRKDQAILAQLPLGNSPADTFVSIVNTTITDVAGNFVEAVLLF